MREVRSFVREGGDDVAADAVVVGGHGGECTAVMELFQRRPMDREV